ncbi:MAG: hypothetical protein JKY37_10220 [Nannocystaceae bacterium]|nr:hypothetical protein [Nannocystaceae bacterium]
MDRMSRSLLLVAACGLMLPAGCAEDPFDLGQPRSCEIGDQNAWVYATMQELYLFSDEMPEVEPREFESPAELVRALRVSPDRWSRVSDKATTTALFEEGKFIGFGFRTKRDEDGNVIVASVHADSPAGRAGMKRGDRFKAVGGSRSPNSTTTTSGGTSTARKRPVSSYRLCLNPTHNSSMSR